jgi:LysM repeat protein
MRTPSSLHPRRWFAAFSLLVLMLAVLLPSLTAFAQAGSLAAVNTGRLNVRTGPGIIFAVVTSVPYNTEVILIGRAPESTWVQVQLSGGQQGWVNRIHLRSYADYGLLPITYNPGPTPPPPQTVPPPSNPPGTSTYVVRAGDTLQNIARRFGTTWQILAAVNGLANANSIFVGQRLTIAYTMPPANPPSQPPPSSGGRVHIVQAGETLQRIAAFYGLTWQQLAGANNLSNANHIFAGQRLVIPNAPRYYTVQAGDTLAIIGARYGVSAQAIAIANNLPNVNVIRVGQTLLIP